MSTELAPTTTTIPITKQLISAPAAADTMLAPWIADPLAGFGIGNTLAPFAMGTSLLPFASSGGLPVVMQQLQNRVNTLIRISVQENANAFLYSFDCPGLTPDDVSITLDGRTLTVSTAHRDSSSRVDRDVWTGARVHHDERRAEQSTRTVLLPVNVDVNALSTKLELGVLNVTVPKVGSAGVRKITVG